MKTTIIGDGGWGTALALVLHRNGHRVTLWGPFPDYIDQVRDRRENITFLKGVALPGSLVWTSDCEQAVTGADVVVLATPSKFMRDVLGSFRDVIESRSILVSVAKGFDRKTLLRMTQIAEEVLCRRPIAALSGPSHAEEVARGVPSAVAIASMDHGQAVFLQSVFNNETFRVYTSDDVIGVEIGGAMKNVIAIAAGISDGIGFGDNTKAALITRGLAEMTRMGVALGAHPSTFAGLSGIGDLIVTCASKLSRNRNVGERLGQGETLQEIMDSMAQVAEGIWTCSTARELANSLDVEAPITNEVYAVAHEGKDPKSAVQDLLARDPKPERESI